MFTCSIAADRAKTGQPATLSRRWATNGGLSTPRGKGVPDCSFGDYDPLLHKYYRPPSTTHETSREREQGRVWGTTGITHQTAPQGSYNPIRCEVVIYY